MSLIFLRGSLQKSVEPDTGDSASPTRFRTALLLESVSLAQVCLAPRCYWKRWLVVHIGLATEWGATMKAKSSLSISREFIWPIDIAAAKDIVSL